MITSRMMTVEHRMTKCSLLETGYLLIRPRMLDYSHQHSFNPCHAEQIKMPHLLLIFSQSSHLIQVVDTNSHS